MSLIDKHLQDKLISYLKINYRNLGTIRNLELITHNNINSINYLIYSAKGTYVLRNFCDNSDIKKMEKICNILNFCACKGAKVFRIIKNNSGIYVDKKRKMYLTKYYDGGIYSGSNIEIKNLAKSLAFLHKELSKTHLKYNYRPRQRCYYLLNSSELKNVRKIIRGQKDMQSRIVFRHLTVISKLLASSHYFLEHIKDSNLKKQLIHYDLHPGNVIFYRKNVSAIIDFNLMRKGVLIEDVAYACFRFSSYNVYTTQEILKKMTLFIQTYLQYNSVDKREIRFFDQYLMRVILGNLSCVIRQKFLRGNNEWDADIEKFINFALLLHKISFKLRIEIKNLIS
jgi:Ser/Thr protein kinase RdoA (MazF antagonist)